MLRNPRIEAGLGNPPAEYTNNDSESSNFMIKYGLKFDKKKPHEFIEEIENIIETQHRQEDRAVFNKGQYALASGFEQFAATVDFETLSPDQRKKKLEKYLKATMNEKLDCVVENQDKEKYENVFPIKAAESGIDSIPIAILENMFSKAEKLATSDKQVVPKPGARDGSYIVGGSFNNIYCVTPGKGDSLKCDRSCLHFSTKICEHVLAVAHIRGTLSNFINWFRNQKRKGHIEGLVYASGPKSAGQKPNKRKRSNKKKPPVAELVDILNNNETSSNEFATFSPPQTSPVNPTFKTPSCSQFYSGIPVQPQHNPNTFFLKWVFGTRVSRCYGCYASIKNPPDPGPDDLVIAIRDMRCFRDPVTGQMKVTSQPQNVHFHLRRHCVLAKYPGFNVQLLNFPNEVQLLIREDHIQRLSSEFGYVG